MIRFSDGMVYGRGHSATLALGERLQYDRWFIRVNSRQERALLVTVGFVWLITKRQYSNAVCDCAGDSRKRDLPWDASSQHLKPGLMLGAMLANKGYTSIRLRIAVKHRSGSRCHIDSSISLFGSWWSWWWRGGSQHLNIKSCQRTISDWNADAQLAHSMFTYQFNTCGPRFK